MPGRQPDSDPRAGETSVFVGREEQLALALRRWQGAVAGSGHLLLVAGEAGIGKTRLLREFRYAAVDALVITTSVFARDIETVGGVLLDLSAELTRTGEVAKGAALRNRLISEADQSGDSSRSRRLLVADLAAIVLDMVAAGGVLLCLEDLHWADELSLDVLERVAESLAASTSMIVATYRSDELYPRTPLRRMRARLLAQRLAEEIRLPRLSLAETALLVELISGGSRSSESVDSVFDRSDGIPLFVEELLADGSAAVPATIADAIALQTAALRPETVPFLEAAAVIGRSFDVDLLLAISTSPPAALDAAVSELSARNLVLASADDTTLDFRHALIRDAVYEAIPPLRRRELHATVARAAVEAGFRDSFISDQFERAHEPAMAYRYALTAARDASRVSAHREAVELFRRAQRTAPAATGDAELAELHAQLAAVLQATDDNTGAATQYAAAIELLRRSGDEIAAARLVPRLAAVNHLIGFDFDRRTTLIDEELERLDSLIVPVPDDVRAGLLAASAAALMLERQLDDALRVGAAAANLADPASSTGLDIDLTVGAVLVFAGRGAEGWSLLESAISRASETRLEATAARGYRMLGTSASVLVEYPRASEWLSTGLRYTAETERWNDHHYIAAHAAHVDWALGDFAGAETVASRALVDGGSGITTQNVGLTVLGYVALGRGDGVAARGRLGEARAIGERMHELQRLLPPLWGLAELDLLEGDFPSAIASCELAYAGSQPLGDAAYLFPFVVTGTRAYLALHDPTGARDWAKRTTELIRRRDIPGSRAVLPHAEGLIQLAAGQTGAARSLLEQASSEWTARDRFWDRARVLIDLAQCATRSRRPRDAVALLSEARGLAVSAGADVLTDLIDAMAVDDESAGPLSARELDVARLVAAGATNREIAEKLVISPKTASSHIEHILAKLGAARRSEIAAWVARTRS